MSTNELEKKMLREINQIDEGLGLAFLKMITKPALRAALKKLTKDPDVKAIYHGLEHHGEKAMEIIDRLKDDPDPKMRALAKKFKK